MTRLATSVVRRFAAGPARRLVVEDHYLVSVSEGSLRLEADGTVWVLPPSRAALIAADRPIEVTVTRPALTSAVLLAPSQLPPPSASLAAIDLSPLARALLEECAPWTAEVPLTPYAETMFRALAAAVWALAERPSRLHMPAGRSEEVRAALAVTGQHLAGPTTVIEVAAAVGLTPRTLARRFEAELGMTWRAALRRLRVLRGAELLAATSMPVSRVAHAVGYRSASAFSAAFTDLVGESPGQHRATVATIPPP